MKEKGTCKFDQFCKFRHPGDPKIMSEEMMAKCQHRTQRGQGSRKESANAAEEINDSDASGEDQ